MLTGSHHYKSKQSSSSIGKSFEFDASSVSSIFMRVILLSFFKANLLTMSSKSKSLSRWMLSIARPLSRSCVIVLRKYVLRSRNREIHRSHWQVVIGIVAKIWRRTKMDGNVVFIDAAVSRVSESFFGKISDLLLDQKWSHISSSVSVFRKSGKSLLYLSMKSDKSFFIVSNKRYVSRKFCNILLEKAQDRAKPVVD